MRILAVLTLLSTLFGLLVWHGTLQPAPQDGRYPQADDIEKHPESFVNDKVAIGGTVVETNPLVIKVEYNTIVAGTYERRTARYTVVDPPATPPIGSKVQVFGTLTGEQTIQATRITLYGAHQTYMITVSFVAGLWVLTRLTSQWGFKWSDYSLRRRKSPIHIKTTLGRALTKLRHRQTSDSEGDDDA